MLIHADILPPWIDTKHVLTFSAVLFSLCTVLSAVVARWSLTLLVLTRSNVSETEFSLIHLINSLSFIDSSSCSSCFSIVSNTHQHVFFLFFSLFPLLLVGVGFAEGSSYALTMGIASRWVPSSERTSLVGFIFSGNNVGNTYWFFCDFLCLVFRFSSHLSPY